MHVVVTHTIGNLSTENQDAKIVPLTHAGDKEEQTISSDFRRVFVETRGVCVPYCRPMDTNRRRGELKKMVFKNSPPAFSAVDRSYETLAAYPGKTHAEDGRNDDLLKGVFRWRSTRSLRYCSHAMARRRGESDRKGRHDPDILYNPCTGLDGSVTTKGVCF